MRASTVNPLRKLTIGSDGRIPPNLRFRIPRDYESPWFYGEESWDLIHIRSASGSVSSWPELYQKVFL